MPLARIPLVALGLAMTVLMALAVRHVTRDNSSLEAQPWSLTTVAGNDLVLNVTHGSCDEWERADIQESPSLVAIAVIYRVADSDCTADAQSECRRVTLASPLAGRALAYGSPRPIGYSAGRERPPYEDPGARKGQPAEPIRC